jgi:hypothetical protein
MKPFLFACLLVLSAPAAQAQSTGGQTGTANPMANPATPI